MSLKHKMLMCFLFGGAIFGFYLTLYAAVIIYIPSQTVTIPYRGAFLGLACLMCYLFIRNRRPCYRGHLLAVLLLFWILYAVAIIIEPIEYMFQSKTTYTLLTLGGCIIPSIPFLFYLTKKELRYGHLAILIGACLVGLLSFVLYGGASDIARASKGEFVGDFVTLGPLQLSYLGSVSILLCLNCLFDHEVIRIRILRYLVCALLGGLGAFQLAIGASRGAVVAVVVVFLLFIFARLRNFRDALGSLAMIFVAAVILVLVIMFSGVIGSALFQRLEGLLYMKESYTFGGHGIGRIYLYQASFQQFLERPLFGGGLVVRGAFTYSHNFIIEAFMSTGIVGGLLFLSYYITCFIRSLMLIRHAKHLTWIAILFLHYAINVQFSSNLASNTYFWVTSAMVLGAYEFSGIRHRNQVPPGGLR